MKPHPWLCICASAIALVMLATVARADPPAAAAAQPTSPNGQTPSTLREEAGTLIPECPPEAKSCEREWNPFDSETSREIEKFIDQTKNPFRQTNEQGEVVSNPLTWGFDVRLRTVWADNLTTLNDSVPRGERHFQRYRSRFWMTGRPTEDIDLNVRFLWEPRVIQKPAPIGASNYIWDEVVIDNLNVVVRDVFELPLTVTAGRQDIRLGNGWLVLDGTPLDGSRTIYFDALRLTADLQKEMKTVFDVIYLHMDHDGDNWLEPFNKTGQSVIEEDERAFILNVTNRSLERTTLEGLYAYLHEDAELATGNTSRLHTFAGRLVHSFDDNWSTRHEAAFQWGRKNGNSLRAFAFNNQVNYKFLDDYNNQLFFDYEFMSGDDPNSSQIEAFDPLWGRWPQWSELYVYTNAMENGRPGEITNFHRLALGWSANPASNITVKAAYHLLFADENTYGAGANFSRNGAFRGQLLTGWLTYKFSKHVSGHLVGEYFHPGNYYSSDNANDPAMFFRYELTFTW